MNIAGYLNSEKGPRLLVLYTAIPVVLVFLAMFARAAWIARDHFPEGYGAPLTIILGSVFTSGALDRWLSRGVVETKEGS